MMEPRSTARGLAAVLVSGKMREQTGRHQYMLDRQVRSDKHVQIDMCPHWLLVKVQMNICEPRSSSMKLGPNSR